MWRNKVAVNKKVLFRSIPSLFGPYRTNRGTNGTGLHGMYENTKRKDPETNMALKLSEDYAQLRTYTDQ